MIFGCSSTQSVGMFGFHGLMSTARRKKRGSFHMQSLVYLSIYIIHNIYIIIYIYLVGGVPTPLKNISQLGLLLPIYGKVKNVPNHQPAIYITSYAIMCIRTLHLYHLDSLFIMLPTARPTSSCNISCMLPPDPNSTQWPGLWSAERQIWTSQTWHTQSVQRREMLVIRARTCQDPR